jgi:hypothetical protein
VYFNSSPGLAPRVNPHQSTFRGTASLP